MHFEFSTLTGSKSSKFLQNTSSSISIGVPPKQLTLWLRQILCEAKW